MATIASSSCGAQRPTSLSLCEVQPPVANTVPAGREFELIVTATTPPILEVALETACPTLQRQQQAIIAGAASYVALNFMKNAEEAARQRAVYKRIVDRLRDQEAARRGGGVQPDTWGSGYGG